MNVPKKLVDRLVAAQREQRRLNRVRIPELRVGKNANAKRKEILLARDVAWAEFDSSSFAIIKYILSAKKSKK